MKIPSIILCAAVSVFVSRALTAGFFAGSEPWEDGDTQWRSHPAFGSFYAGEYSVSDERGWVFHETLGWTWVDPGDNTDEFLLWSASYGWWWTAASSAPYGYAIKEATWYYPLLHEPAHSNGFGKAYNFATGGWMNRNLRDGGDMVLVPAGTFAMGNHFNEGWSEEFPVHDVFVSAYYMARTPATFAEWQSVHAWAVANGYTFDNTGAGKGPDHPVHTVSWFDVVKWCNAKSEMKGLTPVYRTGAGAVYRTGQTTPEIVYANNGFRLPSEAEWEKAARGGEAGMRFPWGDTISHENANFIANGSAYPYDVSPYTDWTYHPDYEMGPTPYTAPAGSFAPNGYGLYGMAGNVWEWCNDWYDSAFYSVSSGGNPTGPASGSYRVGRGGSWNTFAVYCRVATRDGSFPDGRGFALGFRPARSAVP